MSDETNGEQRVEQSSVETVLLVLMVFIGFFLLLNSVGSWFGGSSKSLTGKKAPSFSLESLDNKESVSVSDYPDKMVLLDFWATWCKPCRRQMPKMEALQKSEKFDDILKILSINTDNPGDDRRRKVREFLEEQDASLTTLLDDGSVMRKYGVGVLPTVILIDSDGTVRYQGTGYHDTDKLAELVSTFALDGNEPDISNGE